MVHVYTTMKEQGGCDIAFRSCLYISRCAKTGHLSAVMFTRAHYYNKCFMLSSAEHEILKARK